MQVRDEFEGHLVSGLPRREFNAAINRLVAGLNAEAAAAAAVPAPREKDLAAAFTQADRDKSGVVDLGGHKEGSAPALTGALRRGAVGCWGRSSATAVSFPVALNVPSLKPRVGEVFGLARGRSREDKGCGQNIHRSGCCCSRGRRIRRPLLQSEARRNQGARPRRNILVSDWEVTCVCDPEGAGG